MIKLSDKAVMLSIRPEWLRKIINGEKTLEIRKTKPSIPTPFKVYIYCSQGKEDLWLAGVKSSDPLRNRKSYRMNGTVCAEFNCVDVSEYEAELMTEADRDCYEAIHMITPNYIDPDDEPFRDLIISNEDEKQSCHLFNQSCLGFDDLRKYLIKGKSGFYSFYAWEISRLQVYAKPLKTRDFMAYGDPLNHVNVPPQSWCYVDRR